ncbi:MAG: hypothetical protein D6729_05515 [Deltaproteobacteria bacterium]|nr:MAG: hypothetical protein D6729_05515 [Deltaproteobacteria bacterium]
MKYRSVPRIGLVATLVALAFSGCICVVQSTGDLVVFYRFGGQTCDAAGVDRIVLDVEGTGGTNDSAQQEVDCATFPEGVRFKNLRLGTYTVTVEGWAGTELRYQQTFTGIEVKPGDNEYDLDVAANFGTLKLFWTFAGSGQCGQVQDVRVMVTGPDLLLFDDARYPCSGQGVTYDFAPAGTYHVEMDGIDATGRIIYRSSVYEAEVIAGQVNEYVIDLQPN